MTMKELKVDLMKRFVCKVSKSKLYKAKYIALKILSRTMTQHYAKLRSYVAKLMRVDMNCIWGLELCLSHFMLVVVHLRRDFCMNVNQS